MLKSIYIMLLFQQKIASSLESCNTQPHGTDIMHTATRLVAVVG